MSSPTPRPALTAEIPLPVVTGLTAWFALFAWSGFAETASTFLVPALFGIALLAVVGVVARLVHFPALLVVAAQVLTMMLFANASWGSSVLPTPGSIETAVGAFRTSVDVLGTYAAPVPSTVIEVAPVLVLGGMCCHLLVDLCAVTLSRVPLAGLPLLVVYTLPVGILDRSVNPLVFALTVTGFLMMLALQEGGRIARWGRQFGAPAGADSPGPFGAADARRHPAAIGAVAVILAVAIPIAIPTVDLDTFAGGGRGSGSGDREVRITNPMTDLHRDLVRGENVPLLTVTSKGDEAPSYLRTTVLTTFTGEAWTPGDRDLPSSNSADGELPSPIASDVPRSLRTWDIEVTDDLDSLWLPTPMYVQSISGASDWRFDDETLDIHAATNDMSTQGMSYSLREIDADIQAERLAEAPPAQPDITSQYLDLPSDFPERVEEMTQEVVAGSDNDYERAAALQRWFREEGNFRYSTQRDPGNGTDALLEFLEEGGREGYCEQFASAMAVMARSAGIPARVAVGFFRSRQVGPDRFEFKSHDLHAWPELYFEDTGWVRFEPTPASHIPSVPGYSDDAVSNGPAIPSDSASQSQSDSAGPSDTAPPTPTASPEQSDAAGEDSDQGSFPWVGMLAGLAVLLLLLALAMVPRALRRARSRRRWHQPADPVEAAWAELADSATDLGVLWPAGASPRATGRALARSFAAPLSPETPERPETGPHTNPAAVQALTALVHALEEARYAPSPEAVEVTSLREDVDTCVEAWRGGLGPRNRFWAEWWPRSVTGRRTARAEARQATGPDETDETLVDTMG